MFKNRKDKAHLAVSLVKSALRIIGCMYGVAGQIIPMSQFLMSAEVLGILEELVV